MPINPDIARNQMLGQQIRAWEVLDQRVLGVFRSLPREQYVPSEYRELAFADMVIPLDHGQKIGEGAPAAVKDDPAVVEAYLGREMDDDEVRAAFRSHG